MYVEKSGKYILLRKETFLSLVNNIEGDNISVQYVRLISYILHESLEIGNRLRVWETNVNYASEYFFTNGLEGQQFQCGYDNIISWINTHGLRKGQRSEPL